jgi:UDP-N-acetylmuramyl pentapeptide phosphotransferase/UDP-N-acetylglucosamine-1-phosphate transferase
MIEFLFFIFSLILLFIVNFFLFKNNLLIENKNLINFPHKEFSLDKNIKTILSGGIFFSFFLFFTIKINISLFYYLLIIFTIGLLSDLKLLNSPLYRIILQIIATTLFIYFNENFDIQTRIIFLDNILSNKIFQIVFCTFCILILINGFNFIDGVNLSSSFNFLIIIFFLNFLFKKYNVENINYFIYLIILIFTFCIYNFYSRSFLGDGGVYLLSAFISERVIFLSSVSKEISPYYIVNLLWYPAFENLFSIIRKIVNNKSPGSPDNFHLHHYLLSYVKKKFFLRKQYLQSSVSGIIINLFILVMLILATCNISVTKYQIMILFINIISYLVIYRYLKKNYLNTKN